MGLCRDFKELCWFLCAVFSPGKVYCLVLCPLRPDPCQNFVCCRLSLSLSLSLWFVWSVRRRRLLSCSFLRRWGNSSPFWGLGFPCVSASWPRSSSWIRTPCSASTPRLRPRTCVFFFPRRRRSLVWWWLVLVCLVSVWVGCVGLGGLHFCLACKMYNAQFSHQWG